MLTASPAAKKSWLWTLACVLVLQSGCAMPDPGAPRTKAVSSADITRITLERNCFGCTGGSVLVLQRDGKAVHTVTGNARMGTARQLFEATVPTEAFAALAGLLVDTGFFELKETYKAPDLQDGAWVSVRVERGNQSKQVFNSNDAGPPNLRTIEQAIEAVQAQIPFVRAGR
jgi:hypothetical protein